MPGMGSNNKPRRLSSLPPAAGIVCLVLAVALTVPAGGPLFNASAAPLTATAPTLGMADRFAVLAGEAITNVPTSAITGDVGLSPAAGSNYTGLTAAEVTGTIYAVDATGPAGSVNNPGLLTTAKTDLVSAYNALSAGDNAACTVDWGNVVTSLNGLTLGPGVYCTDVTGTTGAFTLSGTLTLTGSGPWIFRSGSTLITSGAAKVVSGDPCNVWWKVPSSATLGTGTEFIGNILALTSIWLYDGATVSGRLLARNGEVTLDNNEVSNVCWSAPTPTPTPTPPPFIPEASTMVLLGSGLAGLAGYASLRLRGWRRRE